MIMCMIVSLLMNIGLMTINGFGKSFNENVEYSNAPHAVIAMQNQNYNSEAEDYLNNHCKVNQVEKEDILYLQNASFKIMSADYSSTMMIRNIKNVGTIATYPDLESVDEGDNLIYVSKLLETSGKYSKGDYFTLSIYGNEYTYKIAGFIEDVYLGSVNLAGIGFLMNDESFLKLKDDFNGSADGTMLKILSDDPENCQSIISDCQKDALKTDKLWSCYYGLAKTARTTTGNIISAIILAFAVVIAFVMAIVVSFRIRNNLHNDTSNIGTMKVIGYTNHQIRTSYLFQYLISTFLGGLIGVILSYIVLPYIALILSMQSGLTWKPQISLQFGIIILVIIILLITSIVSISVIKLKEVTPVETLYGNSGNKNILKKSFTFEKSKLGKFSVLSLNSALSNIKTNIGIMIIIAALSFVSVFSSVLYYNISIDSGAFIKLISNEICDIQAVLPDDINQQEYLEKIRNTDSVRKAQFYDIITTSINDETVYAYVSEDFSKVENNYIYEGEFPNMENEVSIGGGMAEKKSLKIGDKINVTFNGNEKEFIISGIQQTANNLGMDMSITYSGVARLSDNFIRSSVYIYLDKDADSEECMKALEDKYKEQGLSFSNIDANIESTSGTYIMVVSMLVLIMLIATLVIICIILNLVISNTIIEQSYNIGIQKAIGFITKQLMLQITMIYLPIIVVGSIIGGTLGFFGTNPMLAVLLKQLGIMKSEFTVSVKMVILIILLISVWAYLISMIVSYRIRKISAYKMTNE
jgi:putative ABC transport system permease protein